MTSYELQITQDEIKALGINKKRLEKFLTMLSLDPKEINYLLIQLLVNIMKIEKSLFLPAPIAHCSIIKSILNSMNVESETITSKQITNLKRRLSLLKKASLNILINFGVLTTGFDAPQINTVIIARPTFSIVLYSQMVGRALRGPENQGNKKNRLITLKDNLSHGNMDELFEDFETVWK